MGKGSVIGGMILGAVVTLLVVEYLHLNVQILHNVGLVKSNIGVYWDKQGTKEVTKIDWGVLNPGGEKSVVVYLENAKNTTMSVYFQTVNWSPSQASLYISLSWNSTGYVLANMIVPVSLTLKVKPEITGVSSFSFDIIITGEW